MRKDDILWKINSSDTLQIWPRKSSETYISSPFLPRELVSAKNGIFAPPKGFPDMLSLNGIENAAFTIHRKPYYSERVKKRFPTVIYTLRGTARADFGGNSHILKKGCVFLSATGTDSIVKVDKTWEILWFHMKKKSAWDDVLGKECVVMQSEVSASIAAAAKIYATEIYSSRPSLDVLESGANFICSLIRKDFSKAAPQSAKVESILAELEKQPASAPPASELAKRLSISVYQLDKICRSLKAKTYAALQSDTRMRIAVKKISEGKPLSECAKAAGYSGVFALSKAFKKRYKISPSEFAKQCAI